MMAGPAMSVWISLVTSYIRPDLGLFTCLMVGNSGETPLTPGIIRAVRATSSASDSPESARQHRLGRHPTLHQHQLRGNGARRDIFRSIGLAALLGLSASTMKPRTLSPVWAHTIATSARLPLVIHIFVPASTRSSPDRRAGLRISEGADR